MSTAEIELASWTTEDADKSWLHSYRGDMVHCLDLRDDEIFIDDIAASLSCKGRFNGWTKRFYSVAEHCVRGSWMLCENQALAFLLHDSEEAYTGDMPRPMKYSPAYRDVVAIAESNQAKILAHFGLDPVLPNYVHEVDMRILATEKRDLMVPGKARWTVPAEPYDWHIDPWLPDEARGQFLLRFRQLVGDLMPVERERRYMPKGGRG